MTVRVISVGYERRSIDELIAILVHHKVKKLLDIREAPISRRKTFSKSSLSAQLEEAGIKYRHLRSAGNPHRKEKDDIKHCLRLYTRYLHQHPDIVELVASELTQKSVAVLCYERVHDNCHRSVLLNELSERGHVIKVVKVE